MAIQFRRLMIARGRDQQRLAEEPWVPRKRGIFLSRGLRKVVARTARDKQLTAAQTEDLMELRDGRKSEGQFDSIRPAPPGVIGRLMVGWWG